MNVNGLIVDVKVAFTPASVRTVRYKLLLQAEDKPSALPPSKTPKGRTGFLVIFYPENYLAGYISLKKKTKYCMC